MKTFINSAAQGDILLRRVDKLPEDITPIPSENGKYVVAHSETLHNHVVQDTGVQLYQAANDPLVMYLVVDNPTELRHERSFDTHAPITIDKGKYEIRRQREYTLEGWRKIED